MNCQITLKSPEGTESVKFAMVEHLGFRKNQQLLQHAAAVHEQVRQHNYNDSMRCNLANAILQMLSSMHLRTAQANMVWVTYSAGGGHVSID